MNSIKSALVLAICIASTLTNFGQNFPEKIKDNATMVFSINGKNVLNKVSEEKINQSLLFQEFKSEMKKANINGLSDMGIDFGSKFCFAMEADTNLNTFLFFVPIKDIVKFEKMLVQMTGMQPVVSNEFKSVTKYEGREMITWNNEYAVFVSGAYFGSQYRYRYNDYSDNYNYYEEGQAINRVLLEDTGKTMTIKEKSDRVDEILGNEVKLSEKFLETMMDAIEEEESMDVEEEVIEIITDEVETIEVDEMPPPPPAPQVIEIVDEPVVESTDIEEVVESVAVVEASSYNGYNNNYSDKSEIRNYRSEIRNKLRNRAREIREKKRNQYISSLFKARARDLFSNKMENNSVAKDQSFKNSEDKKADGFMWVKNSSLNYSLQRMMYGMYDYNYGYSRRSMFGNTLGIWNNSLNYLSGDILVMNLYFEKNGIRYKQRSINGAETKKVMNEIYRTSQDNRFLKYVNGDNFIGYMSISINSEGLIKQLPKLYSKAFTSFSHEYVEEAELLSDFMEVFMDEKAISEIAPGNSMFVLKDLKETTVTYSTYEYDENYKRTKVEKTKTEVLPDFLLMFTTENKSLLDKLFKLGIKYKVITSDGIYYSTRNGEARLPMDFFFVIKDGIAFLSTDEAEIMTIVKGGSFKGISKKHSKLIKGNSQVVYYNHEKLMKKIPVNEFRRSEKEAFELMQEYNCEDVVLTAKNLNGNLVAEGFFSTPNDENNGALYLFNYINRVIEFGKY